MKVNDSGNWLHGGAFAQIKKEHVRQSRSGKTMCVVLKVDLWGVRASGAESSVRVQAGESVE